MLPLFLVFISVFLLGYVLVPLVFSQSGTISRAQSQKFISKMDRVLQKDDVQKAYRIYIFAPFILAVVGGYFAPPELRLIGVIAGMASGMFIGRFYSQMLVRQRKEKFKDQLMDVLMIMSSSFRGGLSLIQSIEAVTEEMPDPARHEFGIVLGENKMGVSLDETFNRLYRRIPSPALQQMITAILLARETGGNLPAIFSRIVQSMRERKKIEQNLKTLTVQGKIQAVVMTGLPFLFITGISASNPNFFDPFFHTEMGRVLLIGSIIWWSIGAFFVWRISIFDDI